MTQSGAMISEDLQKFSGSRIIRTTAIGSKPGRYLIGSGVSGLKGAHRKLLDPPF
ncbi:unnamed protein product [Larinioides sclopetarius]|uniref:Uncharacterized protein n=1 Tax=Larinioides sclopetarius TaxID=280406 RepID=A0AAV1ZUZ7_9ARAC